MLDVENLAMCWLNLINIINYTIIFYFACIWLVEFFMDSIGAVCIFHSIMGINSTQRKEYYEYV